MAQLVEALAVDMWDLGVLLEVTGSIPGRAVFSCFARVISASKQSSIWTYHHLKMLRPASL